jgi:hypothetical protein
MRAVAGRVIIILVLSLAFLAMWYEAFHITGVTAPVVPPGVQRPGPPRPPALPPLARGQANVELFGRAHPEWSALSS